MSLDRWIQKWRRNSEGIDEELSLMNANTKEGRVYRKKRREEYARSYLPRNRFNFGGLSALENSMSINTFQETAESYADRATHSKQKGMQEKITAYTNSFIAKYSDPEYWKKITTMSQEELFQLIREERAERALYVNWEWDESVEESAIALREIAFKEIAKLSENV